MTALVWAGKLCAECKAGRCADAGTPAEPHGVECPACAGRGCRACGEEGKFWIDGCPLAQYVDRDMLRLLRVAELMRQGLPPVAGGLFDQEAWHVQAAELLWREQDRLTKTEP